MDQLGSASDRRWAIRRPIELEAKLTDSEGQSYCVIVIDVSEDGFGIVLQTGVDLVRERPHTIAITGMSPLTAYVIWSRGGQAGLALTEPLQEPVVHRLVVKSKYAKIGRRLASYQRLERPSEAMQPFLTNRESQGQ